MPTKRKFYRATFTVVVLTEEPSTEWSVARILEEGDTGHAVVDFEDHESEEIDGKKMVEALIKARSEPGFFALDDEGEDTDEF
jgi:hypothetical protein